MVSPLGADSKPGLSVNSLVISFFFSYCFNFVLVVLLHNVFHIFFFFFLIGNKSLIVKILLHAKRRHISLYRDYL